MNKLLKASLIASLAFSLVGCNNSTTPTEDVDSGNETSKQNEFSAEYEMKGTTSAGLPKSDTFIFEGTTDENGIIKTLNFDIVRNKGMEDEISKKDIYGYEMNVSDCVIEDVDGTLNLTKYSAAGFVKYPNKESGEQFMLTASLEGLTSESTFADLKVTNLAGDKVMSLEDSIAAYSYAAKEAGVEELTGDTLLTDLLGVFGLVKDGQFTAGEKRISYAGYNGGRSYGEQIDAIVDYILANNMTLEDVYEMFKTENPQSMPIEDRDLITGATITFVGDFQRMVYLAMHGELFEGVVNKTTNDGQTVVEVVTQGFGGEVETHVTFDDETGKITNVKVRDGNESAEYGAVLCQEGSEFLTALVEGQDNIDEVDVVSGVTATSNTLIKAVKLAQEAYNAQ